MLRKLDYNNGSIEKEHHEVLHIKIPASTSNLGPGFDVFGLALQLYIDIRIEKREGNTIEWSFTGSGSESISQSGNENYIIATLNKVLRKRGKIVPGYRIDVNNEIPVSKGLGSSGTAIIAGVMAANHLGGLGMSNEEVLSEAVSIEGHADNICPSIFGGLTACLTVNEEVKWVKHRFPSGIKLVFVVPEVHISTKAAREILPKNLPFKDAVYNLQRVSLFLETIRTKNYELLSHLLQDRLHQDYRAALVPGMKKVLSLRPGNGLFGVFLSGSGPVVCAFTNKNSKRIGNTIAGLFAEENINSKVMILKADNRGIRITDND